MLNHYIYTQPNVEIYFISLTYGHWVHDSKQQDGYAYTEEETEREIILETMYMKNNA